MRLGEWCRHTGTTAAELGRAIGVASRMTVTRYIRGERVPRPHIVVRIAELTGGAVTANDFHDLASGRGADATPDRLPGATGLDGMAA